jgi:dephospho-CoA kinase
VLRVGLTGGIASGKSTVAGFLAELGARVIDADRIAQEAIEVGGPAHSAVVSRFGRGTLDEQGQVDRAALARLVFRDDRAREDLNAIVHPVVRAEAGRRMSEDPGTGPPIVVLDAALLVETGFHHDLHRLVVTHCSRDSQLSRLLSRGLSREEAEARIASQASLEAKLAVADYVIDTETSLAETRQQTRDVFESLLRDYEREFGRPAH